MWWEFYGDLQGFFNQSGATNIPTNKDAKKKPRCVQCKKFIGFKTGAHIYINYSERLHIKCFKVRTEKQEEVKK